MLTSTSVAEINQELEKIQYQILDFLSHFLGVPREKISIQFITTFENIRQSVMVKIPDQVELYNKSKSEFIEKNKVPIKKGSKIYYSPPYRDPRTRVIDNASQTELLRYANELGFDKDIPVDVTLRAVKLMQLQAKSLLEG